MELPAETQVNERPRASWSELIAADPQWAWRDSRLVHVDAPPAIESPPRDSALHRLVVRSCYAKHNDSFKVRRKIAELLAELGKGDWGLNLGAGETALHAQVLNLDISDAPSVDIVARGQKLPFKDHSLKLVVSQEVIEHLPDPHFTVREVLRVLKVGGKFYCQIPFIIGYHPGPNDYWRFTREGLAQLFADPHWQMLDLDTSVGHGTGAYRIAVECVAVTASLFSGALYKPAKGAAALLLSPIKLLDLVSDRSAQKDRIPGGYFCVVKKVRE